MDKFVYTDYKLLLSDLIKVRKKSGRGSNRKLAEALGVHTTYLTHVLRGHNHLSLEQALAATRYFSFNNVETDFFMLLVQENRAGDSRTREYFQTKLAETIRRSLSLQEQLNKKNRLTAEEQNIFYSDWTFSAVRLCTALPEGGDVRGISRLLALPEEKVAEALNFLLDCGLCREKDGRLAPGDTTTYVGAKSPLARRLHANWRQLSLVRGARSEEDLMFTSVVTLAPKDFLAVRAQLLETIKGYQKSTDESESENIAYLCLDWIKLA